MTLRSVPLTGVLTKLKRLPLWDPPKIWKPAHKMEFSIFFELIVKNHRKELYKDE